MVNDSSYALAGAIVATAPFADISILLACVALAAAVFIFVFWIRPDAADSAPHRSRLDQLLERRETIFDNLRDLRFEYRAGKFSEGDFLQMKQSLETEVALVIAEIEAVTGSPSHPVLRRTQTSPTEAAETSK